MSSLKPAIAAYFFLAVVIMPQMADMDKVYNIAAYKGEAAAVPHAAQSLRLAGCAMLLFLMGCITKLFAIRRSR